MLPVVMLVIAVHGPVNPSPRAATQNLLLSHHTTFSMDQNTLE